jgi:hypothetical protein
MANNTTTSALKPCPFCGGIGRVESYNCDAEYEFSCVGCGIISIAYLSRDMAAAAWNRRAGESNNAQPAAALDIASDVRAVVQLLSEDEWAEHCTKTDLGQQLEAEITRLVGAATAAAVPVVPSFDEWRVNAGRNHVPWVLREFMREGYDACRAAMHTTTPTYHGAEQRIADATEQVIQAAAGVFAAQKPLAGAMAGPLAQRWIPCSERMPEYGASADGSATGCLVLYERDATPDGGFNVGVWNVVYLCRCWNGIVSHWMPLPTPPAQEDGQ